MIKKAVSCTLLVCLTIICLMVQPFHVFASGDEFDSTNYQLVNYVQSASGVYINTGYKPNQNTHIVAEFSNTSSNTGFFYGVTQTLNGSSRSIGFKNGSSNYQIRNMNSNSNVNITGSKFADEVVFIVDQSPTVTTITSGQTVYSSSSYSYGNYTFTSNLFIFALNNSGNTTGNQYARLYDFKIYESSVLVHHYYPCYRKSDNVVGVYDGVESTFFSGSGGNLSYGSAMSSQYTITTSVSPSNSGSVSGGGSFDSGSSVILTATANSGYSFSEWSDGNTSNPRTITVTSDETYTAIFELVSTPTVQYTISTGVSPSGSGTITGGGTYDEGTVVSLSATANSGFVFSNWSDNDTNNPRTVTVSQNATYTAIFEEETVNPDPDPPNPPTGWTDWTDSDDSEYLEEINPIDLSKIYWSVNYERINDFVQIYQTQMNINSGYNGSMNVSFIGSYYDNSITSLQACNSTSYNYSTSSSNQVDVLTIEPAIYGSFDSPTIGEDGTVFNFGISVNGGTSSNVTTSTNGFSNTTEACRLIGMATGDGSIDGTTLLAAGYQKKTITYNDGSASGHTATFYVPGNEEINLVADLSFLDELLEDIYIQIVNNTKVISHDEFTIRFHGKDGYLFPEYGHVHSDAFLGVLLSSLDFNSVHPFIGRLDNRFYLISQENVYSKFNDTFSYHISDNMYDRNYVDLYWQGTRNPVWKFKTNSYESSLLNGTFRPNYTYNNDYGGYISSVAESYTIQNDDLSINSNLTAGAILKLGLASVNMYIFKSNAILNRFNQLGSMMYAWFNRIYQAIGNITGGNESNEIINNVIEDNDINVDIEFNGLLQNVENYKDDIDLTLPEFNIPSNDVSGIQSLAGSFKQIYQDVYIDNGLGLLIFVPLLLLVLRLIL